MHLFLNIHKFFNLIAMCQSFFRKNNKNLCFMKFKHSSRKWQMSYQKKNQKLNASFSLYLRLENFQPFSNINVNLKPDATNTVFVINQYN